MSPTRAPGSAVTASRMRTNRSARPRTRVLVEQIGRVGERRRRCRPGCRRPSTSRPASAADRTSRCRSRGRCPRPADPGSSRSGRSMFWNSSITWNSGACAVDRAGLEHLHQPLERHLGVGERAEVGSRTRRGARTKVAPRVDVGAQHEGVDEHADDVVECAPRRDRRSAVPTAMSSVPLSLREQHRQRGVHDHEHGRAVFAAPARPAPA